MKKILVIGSAAADIVINLDHLPARNEDVHVISQQMRLGGCAYNTYDMIRLFGEEVIPFFPVGQGLYGDFIRSAFAEKGICTPIPYPEEENGCCYCFVEADGERTFISNHGAEYRFRKEWFDDPVLEQADYAYICGLEIEEPTGENILSFLERRKDLTVFFSPGPRLEKIPAGRIEKILSLGCILHLNEEEACRLSHTENAPDAAKVLFARTLSPVIITLGKRGCWYRTASEEGHISAPSARQKDTVGAGDAHIGALMACLHAGLSMKSALINANTAAAKVVESAGAGLDPAVFASLDLIRS